MRKIETTIGELLSNKEESSFLSGFGYSLCIDLPPHHYHYSKQVTIKNGKAIQNSKLLTLLSSLKHLMGKFDFEAVYQSSLVPHNGPGLRLRPSNEIIARLYCQSWSKEKVSIVFLD